MKPFEGVDVANLGNAGVDGNDVAWIGGGVRIPTEWGVSLGFLYEAPITQREDIFDQRVTTMITWEW